METAESKVNFMS